MRLRRRDALRLAGLGAVGSLAGCIDNFLVEGRDDPDDIEAVDTVALSGFESRPAWREIDDTLGFVTIADDEQRVRTTLVRRGVDPDDEMIDDFLADLDFDHERLVLVESAGPNLCHKTIEIGDVAIDAGRLVMDAWVKDHADEDDACAEAVAFPATLVRVTFEDVVVDEVSVDLTDGWGDETTLSANVDDVLVIDLPRLPGYVAPDGEPDPVEPLACDDDPFERHPQWFDDADVHLGDFERDGESELAMRVDAEAYELGETVDIHLYNVTDEDVHTGNRQKHNVQILTDNGWQDVRGADEGPIGYTDEAVVHAPGEAFTWSLELTEDGLVDDAMHDLRVCPDLQPGRYRFAFFGIEGDGALAVEFDVA
ncbi:MAG: hypothetical protein ACOC42_01545 [Halobacteriota archaeon]